MVQDRADRVLRFTMTVVKNTAAASRAVPLAVNATVTFRPDIIVFGGGVMAQQHMLDRVRTKFTALLNGYLPVPDVRDYIVTPAVAGNGSATLGNFVLAKEVSEKLKK